MKTKLLALILLAGSSLFAGTRMFVGVGGFGYPYYAAPPAPVVHAGYWARPPYVHAYWVGPRYYGHRYYPGYWRR